MNQKVSFTINIKEGLFLFVLTFLLLLLLILGDSLVKWFLFGLIGMIAFFLREHFDYSRISNYRHIYILWFLFLGWSFLSFFSTHSISLTLGFFSSLSLSFIIFSMLLFIKEDYFSKDLFVIGLIMVAFVLTIVSLILLFNAGWGELLPGLNVLYATYGHNHFGAVLLLVIPLVWSYAFNQKVLNKSIIFSLAVLFTVMTITTFGRVIIFIVLIQLLLLTFLSKKVNQKGAILLFLLTMGFVFLFFVKTFFSVVSFINNDYLCPFPSLEKQLCKPLSQENRQYYWLQAIEGIKDHPLVGYGAGTFRLINKKYRQLPAASTSYAHNEYLEVFAEQGVVGGVIFVFLMGTLIYDVFLIAFKERKKGEFSLVLSDKKAILVGIVSIYFDALFDFDWNFLGIFCLTLMMMAFVLREKS